MLALQGAFHAHQRMLAELGCATSLIRQPADLSGIDALILPGGESTTMSRMLVVSELYEPIGELIRNGLPTFGTCAGAILMASKILDGRADQHGFGVLDLEVRRNGYGRQIASMECEITLAASAFGSPLEAELPGSSTGVGGSGAGEVSRHGAPFHAVFIRAPRFERVGPTVEILAEFEGFPVLVRSGAKMAASFHPELATDTRVHQLFLAMIAKN